MLNKLTKGNTMNNDSWQFSFHNDKNISFCVASLLTGYFEYEMPVDAMNIEALQSVHNLNRRQVETAIKTAKEYIKNKKDRG